MTPRLVIASKEGISGITRAKQHNLPVVVVNPRGYSSPRHFGEALLRELSTHDINIVSQNGWLPLTPHNVVQAYEGRIINQHPGPLDPGRTDDFGGKGMYGARVTCARLAYCWATGEEFWTEATTHRVTAEFDKGLLVRTKTLRMPEMTKHMRIEDLETDPAELIEATINVQKKLLPLEHKNVLETVKLFAKGKPAGWTRNTPLISEKSGTIVKAKQLAVSLFPHG